MSKSKKQLIDEIISMTDLSKQDFSYDTHSPSMKKSALKRVVSILEDQDDMEKNYKQQIRKKNQ